MKNWFLEEEKKKITGWLKNQPEFKYDKTAVKDRLIQSIRHSPQEASHDWLKAPNWGLVLAAAVLLIGSSTFAYADQAKPGDLLFPLNKFSDTVILNLPFKPETKARIQAQIVSKRLDALNSVTSEDPVELKGAINESRQLETIKESDESLTRAIEKITESKRALEEQGNMIGAAALKQTLTRIENLAGEQENKIQNLEDRASNQDQKDKISKHLSEVRKAHQKALDALKESEQETDDDPNSQE